MVVLTIAFVLVVAVPVAAGVLVHRRTGDQGPRRWGAALAGRLGAGPAALAVLVAGLLVTFVVSLGLGFLAKAIEDPVDKPVYRWVHGRVSDNAFTRGQDKLTLVGNNPTVQLVCLVAGVVLAFAFGRRRWWLPLVTLAVSYFGEKYLQRALAHIVDRGHPPTTLGTFPSGGVGRILAVYGVVIALVLVLNPRLTRAWRVGLWTGVATAASVEAFTRVYLSKHWLTDAVFALPFGTLLLLTNVAVVGALAGAGRSTPASAAAPHTVAR